MHHHDWARAVRGGDAEKEEQRKEEKEKEEQVTHLVSASNSIFVYRPATAGA